jgi:DNA recombination protein RmuC
MKMVGEMTFGLAVGGFFGFVLGIIIGAWMRKTSGVEQLAEIVTHLRQRLDEWQKTAATQQQVEKVQSDLQQTLAQIDRSLLSLADFTQNNLQPQIAQQLQAALHVLGQVQQALQDARQSLAAQDQSSEQRYQQLLQMASEKLASSETLLKGISETLGSGQERLKTELNQLREDLAVAKENVQRINEQVGILTVLQQTAERVEENINKVVAILTGRRSGQAGEQVVNELLNAVPDDWLERKIKLGSGEVEFAIKMPGGYLIPLDSKFVAPELITQSESDGREQMLKRVKDRAKEVAKYLTDQRVLGFGIAAVPDSVYDLCRDAVKAAAQSHCIVVVPYSLLLPFVLSLYLMAQRLGISQLGKTDQAIGTAFTALEQARSALEKMTKEINSVSNLQQTALKQVIEAINSLRGLTHGEIALPDTATQPTLEVPQQAPEETSPSAPEA